MIGKNLRFPSSWVLTMSLAVGASSCVSLNTDSTPDTALQDEPTLSAEQVAQAKAEREARAARLAAEKAALAKEREMARLATLVTQLSQVDGQMSKTDEELVRGLAADSERGSLAEAAKALASIHLAIQGQAQEGSAFVKAEGDDDERAASEGQEATAAGVARNLEAWANELQVNLPAALAYNQYLKAHAVQVLVLRALKVGGPQGPDFVAELQAAVRQNVKVWQDLQQELSAQEDTGLADENAAGGPSDLAVNPDSGETLAGDAQAAPAVAPALPFGAGEFSHDEETLRQGQSLIDDGKFQDAIKALRALTEGNIFYAAAQEKIKEASNLAVQDLRRKAAKSFQSAIPVADRRARAAYLEEARQHLQAAIDLYPEAEQIGTVKQNLSVINKNIESLNTTTR